MTKPLILYTDSKGVQYIATPDGIKLPYQAATVVTQTVNDALRGGGACGVVVVLPYVRIATPDESKEIDLKNKTAGDEHPTGGM